ncbi:hypothetical protein GGE09_003612 [Roseobacter sp. N2S]|nr:hypothetical protein [Roseobacter sp. N2S]
MIQSDLVGGSLHASRASIGYGRWLTVPYPTDQDVSRSEPRIQANLLLADGNLKERAALLKCEQNDLERIITLRSKSDYVRMLEGYPLADHQAPPIQEAVEDLFSRPQAIDIASAPQTSAKASRDDQFLLEHIIMVEEQLKLHHRSIAEHGQAIKNSDHYKKMMHDFDQLKLSLLRVLEEDLKFGQK